MTMKLLKNILFVAETNDDDTVVLERAIAIARNNQATLTVVGVVRKVAKHVVLGGHKANDLQDAIIEQRRTELLELMAGQQHSDLDVNVKILVGRVFIEVIREVLRHSHDVVIKKAEGNQLSTNIFGSTDLSLLRNCQCPVWIVKSTEEQGDKEIVVALDYDPEDPAVDALNGQMLKLASSLALAEFAELHIVHAWHLQNERLLRSNRVGLSADEVDGFVQKEKEERSCWLDKLIAKYLAAQDPEMASYLKPKLHLGQGNASIVVPQLIKDLGAELVVMGTVGRTGIPGFIIGNTAETILNQIECSVLAVKPDGFVTPVTLP